MSEATRTIHVRSPNRDEREVIMQRARQMRAEVTRKAMVSVWTMLRRSIARKDVNREVTRDVTRDITGAPGHA